MPGAVDVAVTASGLSVREGTRFVIYGAGAIGGVLGARLHERGSRVGVIARGARYEAIRREGLGFTVGSRTVRLSIPVTDRPDALELTDNDVIVLAMKSQDSEEALRALAAVAPPTVPIVCLQNG